MKKKKSATANVTKPKAIRLQSGKSWLLSYLGKNLVKGYSKKYKVDLLCAALELRILGVEISKEYELALRANLAHKEKLKRLKKEMASVDEFQNEDFCFIAGYTSNGLPFGVEIEDSTEMITLDDWC